MTAAHDDVIRAWLEVLEPLGGELRLLGRLADPLLGSNTDDLFVFVPDLHFLSPAQQARFGDYGFNYGQSELLTQLLERLVPLREKWDAQGTRRLVSVQLGDFFDLWRELGPTDPMRHVRDDVQAGLRDVLYRGAHRGLPCLDAIMLLGNHDTQDGKPLPEINFQLKAFNRCRDGKPFLFMTHGDAFDVLEILSPDPLQEFVVHLIGRFTPTNSYSVADWGKAAARLNKPATQMRQAITSPDHGLDLPHGAPLVTAGAVLPTHAVQRVAADEGSRSFARYYKALTHHDAQRTSAANVRVVVMGHSHQAGMLLHAPAGGRPLLLMDTGAWIEKCSYSLAENGQRVTEPSAQLGVLHGNDARIYQVRFTR